MFNIGAIVLAAGMSKRMGRAKLLLPLNEKLLFRYPLELALRQELNPIVLIGGQQIENFQSEASDLRDVEFIRNPNYEQGMASSLKLGIQNIINRTEAVFIFLADQPFVPDQVVQKMIQSYELGLSNGTRVVRPQYNGVPGHPILVHKSLYSEFLLLEGDQGGKEILEKHHEKMQFVLFGHSFWGMDIDTSEDYHNSKQYSS